MSRRIAVVAEASPDFEIATQLADRVLVDSIDWLEMEDVEHHRTWIESTSGGDPLTWKSIPRLARAARLRVHGKIDGDPLLMDAAATRRAIHYLLHAFEGLDAILLIRDQDNAPERSQGMEQARSHHTGLPAIVIGLAIEEREAWVLAGFVPDEEEQGRLDAERANLGFQPHEKSHLLTACKDDSAVRSPKRVLRALTDNNREREQRCWNQTSLDILRSRGTENGLARFLEEIRTRLAPLFGHVDGKS